MGFGFDALILAKEEILDEQLNRQIQLLDDLYDLVAFHLSDDGALLVVDHRLVVRKYASVPLIVVTHDFLEDKLLLIDFQNIGGMLQGLVDGHTLLKAIVLIDHVIALKACLQ